MAPASHPSTPLPAFCPSASLPKLCEPHALPPCPEIPASCPRWSATARAPPQATRLPPSPPLRESPCPAQLAAEAALRASLARRRATRRAGLAASSASLIAAAGALLAQGAPPPLPASAQAAVLAVAAAAAAVLKVELGRDGVLYISRRPPALGTAVERNAIVVRETGDGRGRGAFAKRRIKKGDVLGVYEGELVDNARFMMRYPVEEGVRGDYGLAVDSEWVCDGAEVANGGVFTPAHLNHSRVPGRVNVGREYKRRQREVLFYSTRDIEAGEELLFDYGRDYWRGREELEIW